jgi:hypothetical protein
LKHRRIRTAILLALTIAIPISFAPKVSTAQPVSAKEGYTLTVFAQDHPGAEIGHVFVRLSDGKTAHYFGFYPTDAELAVTGNDPGRINTETSSKPELKHVWDTRMTYTISKDGYDNAIQAAGNWHEKYSLATRNCSHFALAVASSAGVQIKLDSLDMTRPGNVAKYFRANGGKSFWEGTWNPVRSGDVGPVTISDKGGNLVLDGIGNTPFHLDAAGYGSLKGARLVTNMNELRAGCATQITPLGDRQVPEAMLKPLLGKIHGYLYLVRTPEGDIVAQYAWDVVRFRLRIVDGKVKFFGDYTMAPPPSGMRMPMGSLRRR